ncbi:DUF4376 domain-containing protein [Vibrio sp. 2175-1]|uniref:DUF4376 domain-containing protein n=1 Tax=Vibrio TaxID=662 RepID=UPI001CDD49F8|nr:MULTISPECIES: DUF4376 domain-containing protein [Vibrio]MCA2497776.1 DUF4376 domain-containing protein [Vibrio alginolyticus]MDW2217463.1 DUF4376 domain-containing protein [Vibrio sp. 2175-1]
MEFQTISDVPAAIAEFYVEDVRSEPTGNMIEEEYTYLDENEAEQTGTRQVPEYADVTYVVQIEFGEVKSWSDVDRVIGLGKAQSVIERFVSLAVNGDKKQFHDSYVSWLEACAEVDKYNAELADGEPAIDYPEEPIYTATDTSAYLMQVAKSARDSGRYAPITVDGLTYDATQEAYDNLQGVVSSWEIMIADQALIDAGIVVDGQMYWTLADNSNVLVTKVMLEAVVTAIRVRAGLLHAQYQADKAAAEV